MAIDRGTRRGYARAGRAGEEKVPEGPPPVKQRVSRETEEPFEDTLEDLPPPSDVDFCNICRRTGFMLRTLLKVWQATLRDEPSAKQGRNREAVEAAADILVAIYAETIEDVI